MSVPKRVLIFSASAGSGHVRAAQALEIAFRRAGYTGEDGREARHVDVLTLATRMFRHLYSKAYLDFVDAAPGVFGYLYDRTDRPSRTGRYPSDKIRLAFDKLNNRRFVDYIDDFRPDLIVNTHFLPAEIISNLRQNGGTSARHAVVITDIESHRYWVYPEVDRYFVASGEAQAYLRRLGIPGERITLSGIPIDPVFRQPKDRRECRTQLGLDPDLPVVLVLAGGFAVGPIDEIVEALLEVPRPVQIAVMTGRNDEMRQKLASHFSPRKPAGAWRTIKARLSRKARTAPANPESQRRLRLLGFVTDVDVWMSAADILVTKPGGLTTAEALAKGLPMVIVNPIPGQESRNSDYLLEKGTALKASNPTMLAYKVTRLLETPSELAALSRAARRAARPSASEEIVQALIARTQPAREHARQTPGGPWKP